MTRFSVVIPTLNAENDIDVLLSRLVEQTIVPCEILVIDSGSTDRTLEIVRNHPSVRVLEISSADFNHGLTRDLGLQSVEGEYICFLTQDAIPINKDYFARLLGPMIEDPEIALVSGRQVAKAEAHSYERLVRKFNYPEISSVRSLSDVPRIGIKTFFASDVCSAYRRDAYNKCGGFVKCDTNEDMLMAARLIAGGYKVAYESTATVFHSHNLSPRQQYVRNRAVGKFMVEHAEDLMGVSEVGEGTKLVQFVAARLVRERDFIGLFGFCVDCLARIAGNRIGRRQGNKRRD